MGQSLKWLGKLWTPDTICVIMSSPFQTMRPFGRQLHISEGTIDAKQNAACSLWINMLPSRHLFFFHRRFLLISAKQSKHSLLVSQQLQSVCAKLVCLQSRLVIEDFWHILKCKIRTWHISCFRAMVGRFETWPLLCNITQTFFTLSILTRLCALFKI